MSPRRTVLKDESMWGIEQFQIVFARPPFIR